MAAANVITHKSMNEVDKIIDKLQESANSIQDSQKHELASCHNYIEELSSFESEYVFWQAVQVGVIICVVIWQILTLRSYFYAKKLV